MKPKPNIVAIIGRVNVGKSTLFNRILSEPKSLVSEIPGTTRDMQSAKTSWRDKTFTLMDTGGLDVDATEEIDKRVKTHAEKALSKARVVLFVVDIRAGLLPQDRALANLLKKSKKQVIFVANKADSGRLNMSAMDFEWLKVGFGAPIPVSAVTGIGVGDLLDKIVNGLTSTDTETQSIIKIAIIGRPNVGKSSLLNAILGEERFITSPIPHTTREPVDTLINYSPQKEIILPITLIDTAGIRKNSKIIPGLESTGIKRSIEAIKRADVVLFVLDLSEQLTVQDKHLGNLILENQKCVMMLGNKWDKINERRKARSEKETKTSETLDEEYKTLIYRFMPMLKFAPIIFTSALEKKNVHKILETALLLNGKMGINIPETELLGFWERLKQKNIPGGGVRHPKLYSFKQTRVRPPIFHIAIREKDPLNPAYLHFLERRLREWYDLEGVPITVLSKDIKK